MSMTTEYLVAFLDRRDVEAMEAVNRTLYFADKERRQQFERVDMKAAGGGAPFLSEVWAACFNHLGPDTVDDALAAAEWIKPDSAFVYWEPGDFYMDYEPSPTGGLEVVVPPSVRTITQIREAIK